MLKNNFNKFFPLPNFLSMPSFGLDISYETLKFIQLTNDKDGIKIQRYGERKILPGTIEAGKIKNLEHMKELLLSLKEEGLNFARISLPEELTYLFKLRLEKEGLEEIRDSIEFSLEENIPVPAQEVTFSYDILSEDEKSLEVQVVAIAKSVIEEYLSLFESCNILVKSFEIEAQAISRAVIKRGDPETYMIFDFGRDRSSIFIVSNGMVVFTSSIDIGGSLLTHMIKRDFNINFLEAEEMKVKYGLNSKLLNKELFNILLSGISILRTEISKHFLYWHTHKDENGKDNPPIKKIILCGGGSDLLGFSDYFSASMKHPTEVANVWKNIFDINGHIPEISFKESLSYAGAIGLALGDFEEN
jgi:type IV pilus assembly protein PilM